MKQGSDIKSNRLHVRFTKEEYDELQRRCSESTCRNLSEYARNVLLRRSITIRTRNQSMDELMKELIPLRKDLNGIANNLNQVVRKINQSKHAHEIRGWLAMAENMRSDLMKPVLEIKGKMDTIVELWLRESGSGQR